MAGQSWLWINYLQNEDWIFLSRQSFLVQLEQTLKHLTQRGQELSLATSFALSIWNAFASVLPSAKRQLDRSANKSIWDTSSHGETVNQQTPREINREKHRTSLKPSGLHRYWYQQDHHSTDHTTPAEVEAIGITTSSNLLHRRCVYASR